LDNAAVEALKKAKFVPARRMGTAVTTTKRVAFRFRLEDKVE
jgi:outer membrane biosynthesis protein TonB